MIDQGNRFSKILFDQWDFIIENLKQQDSGPKVNYFPAERSEIYISMILDMGFKYEECKNDKGYTIRIWK